MNKSNKANISLLRIKRVNLNNANIIKGREWNMEAEKNYSEHHQIYL